MHVRFSCVSGDRVSDLYNDIWVCNCILDFLLELSVFTVATNAERKAEPAPTLPRTNAHLPEERTTNFCQAPRTLSSPHTGLIWSPAKAMVGCTVWEILLQLKDAALTRPPKHSAYWSFQCLGLRSLLSTKVFLTTLCFSRPYFLFGFLLHFMPKNGNRQRISQQGHSVYPKL